MTNAECRTRRRMRALSAFSIRHSALAVALPPHRDRGADATAPDGGTDGDACGAGAEDVLWREDAGVHERADAGAPDRGARQCLEQILAAFTAAADPDADEDERTGDASADR